MRSVFVFVLATLLVACVFAQQPNSVGSAQEFQFNSIKSMVSYFASKVEELPDQFPYTQEQCSTLVEVLRNQFSQFNRMDDKKRFFALELFKLVKHTPALVQQIETNPTVSRGFNYLLNKALPNLFNEYTGPYASKAICKKITTVYNKQIGAVKGFVGVMEDSVERMTPDELNGEMASYISASVRKVKEITGKKLQTATAEPKKEKKVEKKKESKKPKEEKPKKTEEKKPKEEKPKKAKKISKKIEKKPKKAETKKPKEEKPKKTEEKPKVEQKSNIVELKPEAPKVAKLATVGKANQVEQQKRETIQKYLDLFSTFTHAANTTPMKMAQRLARAYGQKKEQPQPKVEKKPEPKPKKQSKKPKKQPKKHDKKPKKTHVVRLVVKKKEVAPKPKEQPKPSKHRSAPKTSIHEIMQETNSLLEKHNQELNSLLRSTGDLHVKDRRTHFDMEEHEDAEDDEDDDDDHEHKHDDKLIA